MRLPLSNSWSCVGFARDINPNRPKDIWTQRKYINWFQEINTEYKLFEKLFVMSYECFRQSDRSILVKMIQTGHADSVKSHRSGGQNVVDSRGTTSWDDNFMEPFKNMFTFYFVSNWQQRTIIEIHSSLITYGLSHTYANKIGIRNEWQVGAQRSRCINNFLDVWYKNRSWNISVWLLR